MILKKKIILFGAGFYGKKAYDRFKNRYEIILIVDNNAENVDAKLFEVPVKKVPEIMKYNLSEVDIIVCSKAYSAMANQLLQMGIVDFYVMMEGFIYHFDSNEIMMPVEIENNEFYKKKNGKKTILFVQNAACIRTHKIALLMKEAGYNVCLLYTLVPPIKEYAEYASIYENMWGFTSIKGIINFINNSEFDILHCSNEPDILASIVKRTDKPVVFDTHDLQSIRGRIDTNGLMLEYFATVFSDANMYVSEGVKEVASEKYNIANKEVFVLENMVYDQVDIDTNTIKLSEKDGEIHCVYEGGIEGYDKKHQRYFEDIWLKITEQGIHIHFYSNQNSLYCKQLEQRSPYLHYEGNLGGTNLIKEMTKFDCGLVLFNVTEQNRLHLDKTSANKMYEYLNARLPLIVGELNSHKEFVKKYNVGICIDMDDIENSIKQALKIEIDKDFLKKNKLTLKTRKEDLLEFYEKVIGQYKEKLH